MEPFKKYTRAEKETLMAEDSHTLNHVYNEVKVRPIVPD